MKRTLTTIFALALCSQISFAQRTMTAEEYTNSYKDIAIEKMQEYGIPASITLAQGMLESGYGGSELALKANNHFGIKCGGDWRGARVYHSDDSNNDCFRKYRSVEQSYDDHSEFLTKSDRYASLFKLKTNDYEGWAKGLKRAGYATARNYDGMLIDLIEKHHLSRYDFPQKGDNYLDDSFLVTPEQAQNASFGQMGHIEQQVNGVPFIIARDNDRWDEISKEQKISVSKLLRLNDLPAMVPIKAGDKIFLKSKKSKSKTTLFHTAQRGETALSVSQDYGIKLSSLRRMNKYTKSRELTTGDIVRLK